MFHWTCISQWMGFISLSCWYSNLGRHIGQDCVGNFFYPLAYTDCRINPRMAHWLVWKWTAPHEIEHADILIKELGLLWFKTCRCYVLDQPAPAGLDISRENPGSNTSHVPSQVYHARANLTPAFPRASNGSWPMWTSQQFLVSIYFRNQIGLNPNTIVSTQ